MAQDKPKAANSGEIPSVQVVEEQPAQTAQEEAGGIAAEQDTAERNPAAD
jgi:hypothetical protein